MALLWRKYRIKNVFTYLSSWFDRRIEKNSTTDEISFNLDLIAKNDLNLGLLYNINRLAWKVNLRLGRYKKRSICRAILRIISKLQLTALAGITASVRGKTYSTDQDQTFWQDRNRRVGFEHNRVVRRTSGLCEFGWQDADGQELPSQQNPPPFGRRSKHILR